MVKRKKQSAGRRITTTTSVVIIVVLLLGGFLYYHTTSNASQIDNRNLRELSRIGQGIEGRVNNLNTVLRSLAGDENLRDLVSKIDSLEKAADSDEKQINSLKSEKNRLLKERASLIPHFSVDTERSLLPIPEDTIPTPGTVFNFNLADESLRLSHKVNIDTIRSVIHARYEFSALQSALSSDYMETVFLSDEKGSVFMWESDRAGVRIHELAALDTLHFKADREISGVGVSDIATISIAGQDYRFYLLPLRINMGMIQPGNNFSETEYTKWILGSMVPVSEYHQSSLSLDPKMALLLGFLVVAGFLVVPFVRIFTMGPKERLRIGHLLYLVLALIFGTGFIGLYLADVVYYSKLKENVRTQLSATADAVVLNLDRELQDIIREIRYQNVVLENKKRGRRAAFFNLDNQDADTLRMRNQIPFVSSDTSGFYPYFQMIFWTDSTGRQIAKWTPRIENTPRVNLGNREYFRAIKYKEAWRQKFHEDSDSTTCDKIETAIPDTIPYFVESIRSWTTGENLAAVSIPWEYGESNGTDSTGISAVTTKLASLTRPVLPAGINLAVVDVSARTLFHTRPERILEENFAEETNHGDLLRSVLAARACKELELTYGGRTKMMVVRPLPERPLYLILFKDMALIDTVRFEAWFEGGVLFSIWVIMVLILLFILDRIATTRMGWLWPDVDRPGKYAALLVISLPFIFIFMKHAMEQGHLHIHPATLLVPVKYLGLGLVLLSWGRWPNPRTMENIMGWVLFLFAVIVILVLWFTSGGIPEYELASGALSLLFVSLWLWLPRMRSFLNRWSDDLSPRMVYTAAMVSGLLVLGLLPGYLTYKFTFHDHSEHLVKYHQLELVDALKDRQARIDEIMRDGRKDEYRKPMKTSGYDMAFEGLLFETTMNNHAVPESADTTHAGHDHSDELHSLMHQFLGNRIPFLSEASVKMRQLSANQADRYWDTDDGKIHLKMNGEHVVTSTLPVAAGWFAFWRILLLAVVLGGLFLIVYRVARWVFFIHLEHSDPLTLENVLPKRGSQWKPMMLVGTRSISRKPIRKRSPEVYYIDMISLETGADGTPQLPIENIPEEAKAVCLDYIDHRIEEPAWNRFLLEFFEKNIVSENSRTFILITSRDLNEMKLSASSNGDEAQETRRRWNRVLGRFTKVIFSDDAPSASFEISLQLHLIRTLTNELKELIAAIRKQSESQEKWRETKQFVEMLSVKLEWLKEETDSLGKLLNNARKSYEQKNRESGEAPISTEYREEAENLEKLLDKASADLTYLSELPNIDKRFSDRLSKLSKEAGGLGGRIADLYTPGEAAEKEKETGVAGLGQISQQLYKLQKGMRMWVTPSARMKAERTVFREKMNARSLYQTLMQECGRHERLHEIGLQILARQNWVKLKRSEVVDLVGEGAETYYAARWAILTEGERLVAAQLAKGAVVNPKTRQEITRLFARGLIFRSPELRLENKSFARYINDTVSPDQLLNWERAGIPSTWEMIRGPLVFALIVVALFLFWAHRDFLGSTIAFLGTIGVGLGAILNLLSKLERGTGGGAFKSSE